MAKNNKEEFKFIIEEHIGSLKKSEEHGWSKDVLRIIWGDNPPSIDIRNVNMSQNRIGKGISLSNEECDKMVDILLDKGYGSVEEIRKALEKRQNIYTVNNEDKKANDLFVIEINTQ